MRRWKRNETDNTRKRDAGSNREASRTAGKTEREEDTDVEKLKERETREEGERGAEREFLDSVW